MSSQGRFRLPLFVHHTHPPETKANFAPAIRMPICLIHANFPAL